MPKLKTNKAVSKKIKVTGKGKALRTYSKQNHYNSRETGKFKRFKRKSQRVHVADEKNVLKALPYAK
jgi:large subunit ribosomal protein L35